MESLTLSFTAILERTFEFQNFILQITFLNQKQVNDRTIVIHIERLAEESIDSTLFEYL